MDYVLRTVEERGVRFVRLWFTDVLGFLKSFAITPAELETALEEGMTFDGSAIEGYSRVQESDMLAIPDASTFEIVPWRGNDAPVARIFCDVARLSGEPFEGDPRQVLKRNLERAREKGFTFYAGPEMEFFYFENSHSTRGPRPRRVLRPHPARHGLEPAQADDHDARGDGHPGGVQLPRARPEPARDRPALHGRADDGRQRDDVPARREGGRARPRRVRDLHAEAHRRRLRFGHAHASLALRRRRQRLPRRGRRARAVEGREGVHRRIAHARREITAVTNQWVNSYKRLSERYEAPVYVCWARNNRSALVRVPIPKKGKESSTRIEFRSPDPACNPYLAFSVMLAAGLRGVEEGYELPPEATNNIFQLTPEERAAEGISALPQSLGEAIDVMESSELVAETLGEHVFDYFIRNKRAEWADYRAQVTPFELERYLGTL